MTLTNTEFQAILDDTTKVVAGDISWSDDEDHSPSVEFRAEIESATGWPLFVKGSFNRAARTLSYVLIHKGVGRIYALDLGKDHHNPSCNRVGDKHKHAWTETQRDKEAYVPEDITAGVDEPLEVWRQFLAEAKIEHRGEIEDPPHYQEELWLP